MLSLPTTLPANSSSLLFAINIRDNGVVEDPKMFSVGLAIGGEDRAASSLLAGRLANVTIADDDCEYELLETVMRYTLN